MPDGKKHQFSRISIRTTVAQKERMQKYAKKEDRSLSNWLLRLADEEIKKQIAKEGK